MQFVSVLLTSFPHHLEYSAHLEIPANGFFALSWLESVLILEGKAFEN